MRPSISRTPRQRTRRSTCSSAVERAKDADRFREDVDPLALATQTRVIGHGLASLVLAGPLPRRTPTYGATVLTALFCGAAGDVLRVARGVQPGQRASAIAAQADSRDLRVSVDSWP